MMDVDRIIFLFECVLLEKSIHLISNYISLPGLIAEALMSLIFPFEYTHMLAPVLPVTLRQYIEAPFPYIVGYSQKKYRVTLIILVKLIRATLLTAMYHMYCKR